MQVDDFYELVGSLLERICVIFERQTNHTLDVYIYVA